MMSQPPAASPYSPQSLAGALLQAPLTLYRLGWGAALGWLPLMVLTTKCRDSGKPRHELVEFRRHGSQFYVVSGWGDSADWVRNARAEPEVTIQHGAQVHAAYAQQVEDPAESLRALYMFSRNSWVYARLFARISSASSATLNNLAEVADEFTVLRLEAKATAPSLPPLPFYSQPTRQFALMLLLSLLLRLLWRLRQRGE